MPICASPIQRAVLLVLLCLLWLAASGSAGAQQPLRQIILMQNSGWMLPFYEDPQDRYRALIGDLAQRLQPYSADLVLASFNQSVGSNESPLRHYHGRDPAALAQAARAVQIARRPGTRALADTDFREALVGAIQQFTPGQAAIVWIVTNNRNSPDNSPETLRKNRDFYLFLQETAEVKRIVALPLALQVQSRSRPDYRANGLMIYGIAYGAAADTLLQTLLAGQRVFGNTPVARLKPLDAQALTFIPAGVDNPQVRARLAGPDQRTLVLELQGGTQATRVTLTGHFRNDFFPFDIQRAQLGLQTFGFELEQQRQLSASVYTPELQPIAAGAQSQPVQVELRLPPLPSMFDPQVLFADGHQIAGVLRFQLLQQELRVAPAFVEQMNRLFPGDPLPDLFVPGEQARSSVTDQPLVIMVNYPVWPIIVLASLGLLLLLALAGGLVWLLRGGDKPVLVSIDGYERKLRLKRNAQAYLLNAHGVRVGLLKRGLWGYTHQLDAAHKQVRVSIKP